MGSVTAPPTTARPAHRDPNVLRWLGAYTTSVTGDLVYFLVLSWAVARVAGPAEVGLVLAVGAIPRALLMLPGGVVADRYGPRQVVILSDLVRCLTILAAAGVSYTGGGLWPLVAVALIFGAVDALFMPAVGALPPLLTDPGQLTRVQALRSLSIRLSNAAGPLLAALVLTAAGAHAGFLLAGTLFAVSLVLLWRLPIRRRPAANPARERGPHLAADAGREPGADPLRPTTRRVRPRKPETRHASVGLDSPLTPAGNPASTRPGQPLDEFARAGREPGTDPLRGTQHRPTQGEYPTSLPAQAGNAAPTHPGQAPDEFARPGREPGADPLTPTTRQVRPLRPGTRHTSVGPDSPLTPAGNPAPTRPGQPPDKFARAGREPGTDPLTPTTRQVRPPKPGTQHRGGAAARSHTAQAVSFAAARQAEPPPDKHSDLRDGLRYLRRERSLLPLVAVIGLGEMCFSGPVGTGLVFLVDERGWTAGVLGATLSAFSVGGAVSGLSLAAVGRVPRPGLVMAGSLLAAGILVAATGLASSALLAIGFSGVLGLVSGVASVVGAGQLQTRTDPRYLGRVTAVTTLCTLGLSPVVLPAAGIVSAKWGTGVFFLGCGVVCLIAAGIALAARDRA